MGKVKIEIYCYLIADILTKIFQECSWSSPLQTILILSKLLIMIGCHGNRNIKFKKKYSKIFFLEVIRGMKLKLCINVCLIILYINYVFYCCCICGYIAMATFSFHRGRGSSIGSEFAWHASGPEFDPHVRHILSWRLGHENISTAILPLPLIQEVVSYW